MTKRLLIAFALLALSLGLLGNRVVNLTGGGGGGGLTFTPVFSDNFTGTDFQNIGTAPRTGWAQVNGGLFILTNATYPGAGGIFSATRVTASHSADQYAELTISAISGGTSAIGVGVRYQSGAFTGYQLMYILGLNELRLQYVSAGAETTISSYTRTYSAGNKIRLYVTGAGTAARLNVQEDVGSGWVNIATDINPAVDIDGGTPGLSGYDSNTSLKGDDYVGGDVTL